jgi:hypothetical protein
MALRKVPMHRIRERYKQLKISRKWLFAGLLLFALSLFINILPVIFLGLFCIINALLLSIDRYLQAPLDIEFSTFSAVLMTIKYDIKWGIAAAVLTKLAAIAYNKNIRVDHFFMIFGYIIAAFIASIFHGLPIILLGFIVTAVVNMYVLFISKFVTMLSPYEIMMYGSSNLIFNIVLFVGFAHIFLRIMV